MKNYEVTVTDLVNGQKIKRDTIEAPNETIAVMAHMFNVRVDHPNFFFDRIEVIEQ